MLPVLPFIIGGALGAVAGVALKKYYDENDIEIALADLFGQAAGGIRTVDEGTFKALLI